jgi:hypothetical protein
MDPELARHNKAVAERLNELLDRCNKTRAGVAKELGKDQGSCTPWFNGTYAPRRHTVLKLGRILDPGWGPQATVHYILTGLSPEEEERLAWQERGTEGPLFDAATGGTPPPSPMPRVMREGGPRSQRLLLEQIIKRLDDLVERVARLERKME